MVAFRFEVFDSRQDKLVRRWDRDAIESQPDRLLSLQVCRSIQLESQTFLSPPIRLRQRKKRFRSDRADESTPPDLA
jgi:hypothetical protein